MKQIILQAAAGTTVECKLTFNIDDVDGAIGVGTLPHQTPPEPSASAPSAPPTAETAPPRPELTSEPVTAEKPKPKANAKPKETETSKEKPIPQAPLAEMSPMANMQAMPSVADIRQAIVDTAERLLKDAPFDTADPANVDRVNTIKRACSLLAVEEAKLISGGSAQKPTELSPGNRVAFINRLVDMRADFDKNTVIWQPPY